MSNEPLVKIPRKGLMLILSSPSGAGKTTLAKRILDEDPWMTMSVSMTTRPARAGEVDGQDYFFVSVGAFQELQARGAFLESAEVFDNYYGTPIEPVDQAIAEGRDILFDIDWQGTKQIREARGDDAVTVFILPPSAKVLEERLRQRAQDSEAVVKRRMAGAGNEIKHWSLYDYVVVNEDVENSLNAIKAILWAERLKRERRVGLSRFVEQIQKDL